jgi:carbamate kinase
MLPKVEAACRFAATGGRAAIGSLADVAGMIDGTAGTVVTLEAEGIEFHP